VERKYEHFVQSRGTLRDENAKKRGERELEGLEDEK
jgi:hypothetical protein